MANKQERISAAFSALADPTRRRILERLSRSEETRVTTLAKPFRMSLPAISKHLKVLENANLIQRTRAGREHLIRSNVKGLKDAQQWIAHYVEFWEASLDRLEDLLATKDSKASKRR